MFPVVITRLFFTVYFGPKRRLEALAVFLLCGPADSDTSFGPVVPPCRSSTVLFQYSCLFFDLFFILPTWRTAVGADFCPLELSWHLESRWNREVDVGDDVVRPFSPRVTDRRLPSTDAAPESPEAGWCDRLSRPADSWISRLFLRSLRPRSPLSSVESQVMGT